MATELFALFLTTAFINNIILSKFTGMCAFLGVSKKSSSAIGMGLAVIFVIVVSSIVTYGLYYLVLEPLGIEYMELITFILVIAALVQFVEMVIKKFSPSLYKALGIYLPLITTNCAVLYVVLDNITQEYNFAQMLVNAVGVSGGYTFIIFVFSKVRERLESCDTPRSFKGNPIAVLTIGIMALAFAGLAGLV